MQRKERFTKGQKRWLVLVLAAVACCLFFVTRLSYPAPADASGLFQGKGTVQFFDPQTHEPLTGQRSIQGYWFMFEPETGEMVTGFYDHTDETNPKGGPKTCYYDEAGHMLYGQQRIEENWYMFQYGSGAMVTGWYAHDERSNPRGGEKICYYDAAGRMLYGRQEIDGQAYLFDEHSGALLSGDPPMEEEAA